MVYFFIFITFRMKIPVANRVDSDQTPRFVASNLRLTVGKGPKDGSPGITGLFN